MYYGYNISDETARMAREAERDCAEVFERINENCMRVSSKVLSAFQELRVGTDDFVDITGYGYSDSGRDKLEALYAKVFGAEDALVRPQLMSGTHALAVTLGGLLKPGDTLVYISGEPYDTLRSVIGTSGDSRNSLIKSGDGGVPQIRKIPIIHKTAVLGMRPNMPLTPLTRFVL